MLELHAIRDASTGERAALLTLNNCHALETSFLTGARWDMLVGNAFYAAHVAGSRGFLIALDEAAAYDSVNFQWFVSRFQRFVYVDRIIVSADSRSQGIARSLYEDLFEAAAKAGHTRVCCEVNRVPPNPGSDAFHERMGFAELETVTLAEDGKTVRYLCREL